ncbi:MAG: Bax inhibitor-1 family protein [Gemmataceae bacterium]
MAYLEDGYVTDRPAAYAMPAERVAFIRKTYGHLAGAVMAFAAIEALLLATPVGQNATLALFSLGKLGILVYMALFVGVGMFAQSMSFARSRSTQYLGLGLYVVLQAIIVLPLLYIAVNSPMFAGQYVVEKAVLLTLGIFAGLTLSVFLMGKDFSFLGPILCAVSVGAIVTCFCGVIFGFDLGLWFTYILIALAAAYIIYDTSNVLHRYGTEQYVGASLALFASVALLFRMILQLLMSRRN